ncbi:MAG TPA: methylated-DNA--[protein]-cysteine S-methyltransferase [Actinobacteria bacterium]|nr:methylated-DNA--[protein]-cysteine S-methyltransferase [Actinomycetota bacterium]
MRLMTYSSPFGHGVIVAADNRVRHHLWGAASADLLREAQELVPGAVLDILPPDLSAAIKDYFAGFATDFNCWGIDWSGRSEFSIKVYRAVRSLEWGETASYSEIAGSIGHPQAARAVGSALGDNPVPLFVPCHRVLAKASRGGWSGPPGWKSRLLKLEGVEI